MVWSARCTVMVNHFRATTRLAADRHRRHHPSCPSRTSSSRTTSAARSSTGQPGVPQVWPSPEVPPTGATTWPATATTPPTTAGDRDDTAGKLDTTAAVRDEDTRRE